MHCVGMPNPRRALKRRAAVLLDRLMPHDARGLFASHDLKGTLWKDIVLFFPGPHQKQSLAGRESEAD